MVFFLFSSVFACVCASLSTCVVLIVFRYTSSLHIFVPRSLFLGTKIYKKSSFMTGMSAKDSKSQMLMIIYFEVFFLNKWNTFLAL